MTAVTAETKWQLHPGVEAGETTPTFKAYRTNNADSHTSGQRRSVRICYDEPQLNHSRRQSCTKEWPHADHTTPVPATREQADHTCTSQNRRETLCKHGRTITAIRAVPTGLDLVPGYCCAVIKVPEYHTSEQKRETRYATFNSLFDFDFSP